MYLKTLTLKGFKSFADPTTIELEPGVTVVVGPNGSGKSNVVDAVAWVLGAQGPRVVRSAKMDDVIFAGTPRRSALGRAEVSLTIDNSSRRLPIDFTEVMVTRTLFRTGESEYAINGAPCRLLDVQELLSDSGVGRQQHVIIGQGQLDAVLSARPEDRRSIVEEAAGVLKYRRRRERAERRLESSEAGLARLQDLLREVQRQLRPLERQAASAVRHEELVAEQRALRLHLARAEIGQLRERLSSGERRRDELDAETAVTGGDLARTWSALSIAEDVHLGEPAGALDMLGRDCEAERLRARQALSVCSERRRALGVLLQTLRSTDHVSALEADAAQLAEDLARVVGERALLAPEWDDLEQAESDLASTASLDEQDGATADALDSAPPPDLGEVRAAAAAARARAGSARELLARVTERVKALDERRGDLAARRADHARSAAALTAEDEATTTEAERLARASVSALSAADAAAEALRAAEEEVHAATARAEVLALALDEARARAGVERLAGAAGVVGTLLDVVEVAEHVGLGLEAALDGALAAVLVAGSLEAREALELLRGDGGDGSVLPLVEVASEQVDSADGSVAAGTELLRASVRSNDPLVEALLDRLLGRVLLCPGGLDSALDVWLADPHRVVVTPQGDRLSWQGWRLGAGRAGATRAALEAAEERANAARRRAAELAGISSRAAVEAATRRDAAEVARRRLETLRADLARHLGDAAALSEALETLEADKERVVGDHVSARTELDGALELLGAREQHLEHLERIEADAARQRDAVAVARREIETRARVLGVRRRELEVRAATLEERFATLGSRREEVARQLAERRDEAVEAERLRTGYERDDRSLARLASALEECLAGLGSVAAEVAAERDRRTRAARLAAERLQSLRARRDSLERTLASLRERRQRLEIEGTEARVRHETALETLRRDLGVDPDELGEAPLPHLGAEADASTRLRSVEAEMERIGSVNPLARDELESFRERSTFLERQIEDVRSARRELGQVIGAVDREIAEVFSSAYDDVSRHFSGLFTTLFPGGTGRLSLTAPDDLLSTGIEIEARPAGRSLRRLSLLSGGERSLVAMAFLFAVFRSRPSPFYLMDEVEAALDDVNLGRFLDLVEEFRDEAQLLIVSHQKRTMEVADALYGVTMQPGGASKVVSEKVRRRHTPTQDRTLEVQ